MRVVEQAMISMLTEFAAVFIGAGIGGCVGLFLKLWFTTKWPSTPAPWF